MSTLILGHSFVHCLLSFIEEECDSRTMFDFGLERVYWHGLGGRTVPKLLRFDLNILNHVKPDIVVLFMGSNDLSDLQIDPTMIGSTVDDLVIKLHHEYKVKHVIVNQVFKRTVLPHPHYNYGMDLLSRYLSVVIEAHNFATFWRNAGMWDEVLSCWTQLGCHRVCPVVKI